MSFLGFFNFTAPYLPWVLLAFSVMLGGSPVMDLMGMGAGAGIGAGCVVVGGLWSSYQADMTAANSSCGADSAEQIEMACLPLAGLPDGCNAAFDGQLLELATTVACFASGSL